VRLNGRRQAVKSAPGSWVSIQRSWKNGDRIEVSMPFSLRTEGFADNPKRFAFLNGPLVLATQVEPGKPFPAVVADPDQATHALASAGKPNTFTGASDVFRFAGGDKHTVTLEPFYAIHGGRSYMVYFDSFTPAEWKAREQEYAAQLAHERELAARTIDAVAPDGEQSERDHSLKGEKMGHGDFGGRKWRHATDGGWFSWQMKVQPDESQQLSVTYWGSDVGNRVFDVYVDDQKVATQRLQNNKPDKFYEADYAIPAEIVKGKQMVTVRFQAHSGATAGGVFGVRIMRSK
jgi:hypothetical protein